MQKKPKVKKPKPKHRKKIRVDSSNDVIIYDYSIYKIQQLIDETSKIDPDHPDIYVLQVILEYYLRNNCWIEWVEGYPMIEL